MSLEDQPTEPGSARTGKHCRRGEASVTSWTPSVPASQHRGTNRHRGDDEPTTQLPLLAQIMAPTPRTKPPAESQPAGYGQVQGGLWTPAVGTPSPAQPAVPEQAASPAQAPADTPPSKPDPDPALDTTPGHARGQQSTRRAKVTLAPHSRQDGNDVRVYVAPPEAGLGKFDLGTVPASVTPPRSWRKAAWFATVSSGGVVVALLFAGSFLVSQPSGDQAIEGWTDRRGSQPTVNGEAFLDTSTNAPTTTQAPATSPPPSSPPEFDPVAGPLSDDLPDARPGGGTTPSAPGNSPNVPTGPVSTPTSSTPGSSTPTTTRPPQKPPIEPAQRTYAPETFPALQPDPDTMGDRSEAFLNKVTEDPAAAAELTTGQLREQGAAGLQRRYADIAYFQVKTVHIDRDEGVTVNTVKTVRQDGSASSQRRTLSFGDDAKIESDGG